MLNILIATGGTGGHLFPAQQLAAQLKGDCDLLFAGHKLQNSPFLDPEWKMAEIVSASSKKKGWTLLKGIWQSIRLIYKFRPDVVIGFGSFHSFPILAAALILRKKILLFEPNCSFGKVNRFFAPFAEKVAFQFPTSYKGAVYVPLLPWKKWEVQKEKKEGKRKTILVFGGSQGASAINEAFFEAAKNLSFPFEVIHLTGKEQQQQPHIRYEVPALVKPFEKNMAELYARADFAICRCGASTIAELIRSKVCAIVIPYPFAHDHQKENGKFFVKIGGGRLIEQKELTPKLLQREIEELVQELDERRQALENFQLPEAEELRDLVLKIGGKK